MENYGVRSIAWKVIFVGDVGVGKTSIIQQWVHGKFTDNLKCTIGADFAIKCVNYDEGDPVRLTIWDIAGQARYHSVTPSYYRAAVGCFVVFDLTNPESLQRALDWKRNVNSHVFFDDQIGGFIPAILLANKVDLVRDDIKITPQQLTEFCEANDFQGWMYTSAKENTGIEEAGKMLIDEFLPRLKYEVRDVQQKSFRIKRTSKKEKKESTCSLRCGSDNVPKNKKSKAASFDVDVDEYECQYVTEGFSTRF